MRRLTLLFCLAALAAPALDAQDPATSAPPARRRVAVLDFDYGTVHSYVTDIWGSDVDIGKGIASMLLTELVQNGTYLVIERTQVDRILNEQNLQQDGRADASTAAKLGRLLGVDAIIIGSITQFGRDDKKLGVGGGKIGFHGIGLGGFGKKSSKATVAIDARIVNIGTGEVQLGLREYDPRRSDASGGDRPRHRVGSGGAQDSGDHRRDHGARRRRVRERAGHQRRDGKRRTDRH